MVTVGEFCEKIDNNLKCEKCLGEPGDAYVVNGKCLTC